ncbi:MAG: pilus assembly protein PilP [Deltaproteobacteria bacterium]|nr:pilus assembly protein PilP [Deltaproteobacteria bacterium]MBW2648914.1 pilus assembly protein PilP [Deltaproteobacteria bacterium]
MQNRTKKRSNHPFKWVAAALVVLFLFPVTAVVYCADPGDVDTGTYRYNPEGKPDPFKPFIKIVEKGKSAGKAPDTQLIEERAAFIPPLQRFSTEEFRLTGIVLTGAKRFAMVETPEGKRYLLRRNTRIGINEGRVIKILSDSVVVLEKIKDFEGNTNTERIILTLRKNGGNP